MRRATRIFTSEIDSDQSIVAEQEEQAADVTHQKQPQQGVTAQNFPHNLSQHRVQRVEGERAVVNSVASSGDIEKMLDVPTVPWLKQNSCQPFAKRRAWRP